MIEGISNFETFIKEKRDLLRQRGIIILGELDSKQLNSLRNVITKYKEMDLFFVGRGSKQKVVLRYKHILDENMIKKIRNEGEKAYNLGFYEECIEDFLIVVASKEPKATLYSRLGMAYLKAGHPKEALDYLYICDELCKMGQGYYNHEKIILSLKTQIEGNSKPDIEMNVEDFEEQEKIKEVGNIPFTSIHEYITKSGLSVEESCKSIGLSDEDILIVLLVYARIYYTNGNYAKGDEFMKAYEKSKLKTQKSKALSSEIRKNKKFYINRKEDTLELSLQLKPR